MINRQSTFYNIPSISCAIHTHCNCLFTFCESQIQIPLYTQDGPAIMARSLDKVGRQLASALLQMIVSSGLLNTVQEKSAPDSEFLRLATRYLVIG